MYKPIEINDTLKFGKYKGKIVDEVLKYDGQYFYFLMNNTNIKLSQELIDIVTNLKIQQSRKYFSLYFKDDRDMCGFQEYDEFDYDSDNFDYGHEFAPNMW